MVKRGLQLAELQHLQDEDDARPASGVLVGAATVAAAVVPNKASTAAALPFLPRPPRSRPPPSSAETAASRAFRPARRKSKGGVRHLQAETWSQSGRQDSVAWGRGLGSRSQSPKTGDSGLKQSHSEGEQGPLSLNRPCPSVFRLSSRRVITSPESDRTSAGVRLESKRCTIHLDQPYPTFIIFLPTLCEIVNLPRTFEVHLLTYKGLSLPTLFFSPGTRTTSNPRTFV